MIIPLPDRARAVGVCLGGRDLGTLYGFGGGKVWARPVKVHGFGAFSPFARMTGSKL